MKPRRHFARLLPLCFLLLAACSLPKPQPDPTRFYVLGSTVESGFDRVMTSTPSVLGIKDVKLAPYLDNRSMVVRTADHEVVYRNYARWGDPLAQGIYRRIRQQLQVSFQKQNRYMMVIGEPFPFDHAPEQEVTVEVRNFEGVRLADGGAQARVAVHVVVRKNKLMQEFDLVETSPWDGHSDAALATALGEALDQVTAKIMAQLFAWHDTD